MAVTLQVGVIGVEIVMLLTASNGQPLDLTTAIAMKVYLRAPDTTGAAEKVASKIGSGKEGKLLYVTVAGDLPVTGDWRIQSRVLYDNPPRDLWSSIYPFIVAPNLV
jgi:hypothetical protein